MRRKLSPKVKKEAEEEAETDAAEETNDSGTETEPETLNAQQPKTAALASDHAEMLNPPTKIVLRALYSFLLVAALCAGFYPEKALEFAGGSDREKETLLCRALGVAIFALCLQHIAAVEMPHASQKRSLQYGMCTWILLAAFAIHSQTKDPAFHGAGSIVGFSLVSFALSLWACYYC